MAKRQQAEVFIGSSGKSLKLAYEVQERLDRWAKPRVWDQDVFKLSRTSIENLLSALDVYDFAVFILSPDDVSRIANAKRNELVVRDNVVFELGLFMGRLGRERTFLVMPRGVRNFHIATDLLGMTVAEFREPKNEDDLAGAMGPACNKIRKAIEHLGIRRRKTGASLEAKVLKKLTAVEKAISIMEIKLHTKPVK